MMLGWLCPSLWLLGCADPGGAGRRVWGWARLLPGPAGARDVASPAILQHLPWVVAASPWGISAKELFLGTFSYSVWVWCRERRP